MSEEEEEVFCSYGTPLEPYDEDAFPKRKPITIEEQIATDSHGRRRFHGAFTGGFSAGFFNTVGSLEGWTPSEFKSSRQDKAKLNVQKPGDFMDDEDTSEYGIAPQKIRATNEYSTIKKRPRQIFSGGPIPGDPVLETFLTSGNETVGYLLLRNMGIEDKLKKHQEELSGKIYGCEMPTQYKISDDVRNKEYNIPEIYQQFLDKPKINTSGLGYEGLEKPHINLFQQPNFIVRDKEKKISIGGQAFGVGAFEDDDEDIYAKEDLSNYDFELTKEKEYKRKKDHNVNTLLFGLFKSIKAPLIVKKVYRPPSIPHSFTGIHKVKKSRFEPTSEENETPIGKINPAIRARYLGEELPETATPSNPVLESPELDSKQIKNDENNLSGQSFDPISLLTDKFVSASQPEDISNILEPVRKMDTDHGTQQMRDASRMKMYGPLTRITSDWHPSALLCKRFNVPEPFLDRPISKDRKRTKNLIFEYQKHSHDEPELKPGISKDAEVFNENLEVNITEEFNDSSSQQLEIKIEDTAMPSTSKITDHDEGNIDSDIVIKEEIQTPLDITDRIGVADKIDLYKAVFLDSSSESEDEKEENSEEKSDDNIEQFKSTILSDDLIPKIKPLKEGILSNIDFSNFNKNKQPQDKSNVYISEGYTDQNLSNTPPEMSYGPQLPITEGTAITNQVNVLSSSDSDDCWVEKDDHIKSKKKSKHKKDKKEKKHKKHRHKKNKH